MKDHQILTKLIQTSGHRITQLSVLLTERTVWRHAKVVSGSEVVVQMQWKTYQRFHLLSHLLCGPSDEPTHYCTWSRSGWRGWLYSTGSQACSSQYKLLQALSGSVAKVPGGQMEKFLAVHEKSRRLVKQEESRKCSKHSKHLHFTCHPLKNNAL